jgi:hypothetical protein
VGVVHGVDLDRLPACDQVGQYYKNEPIDMYAAILHENAILQKAYAFVVAAIDSPITLTILKDDETGDYQG